MTSTENESPLLERLESNALEHLIAPLISIDEYESKIDDKKVIVTAFFVRDYDPAVDLSSFIERSSIRPLDTEVSPAPNDEGWYLVFVEMSRDEEFPDRVCNLVDQVDNLTNVKTWQFTPYSNRENDFYPVKSDVIRMHVNLDPDTIKNRSRDDEEPESNDLTEQVGVFLSQSLAESVEIRGEWLRIHGIGTNHTYKISSFKQGPSSMPIMGMTIGDSVLREARRLENLLGASYMIECGDGHICVNHADSHLVLVVDS